MGYCAIVAWTRLAGLFTGGDQAFRSSRDHVERTGLPIGTRRALSRGWCDDADVIDEANTAQARELLQSLHAHVDEISKRVESAEGRTRRVQGHAAVVARRRVASLRHELYEAHRLIDGLHRRFPDARPRRVAGPRTEFSR
jgi:hypothetical protein